MSFEQQDIEQLKLKVNIQNIQENTLLTHLCLISFPILLSKFVTSDIIPFRIIIITIYIVMIILIQFALDTLKYQILRYIYLFIYILCRIYIIWMLSRNKIIESFFIVMSITYLSVYCFLKTQNVIKGQNLLRVSQYKWHIIIISFLSTFLLVQELYFHLYVIPIYWLFMIFYMIYLLLDLQLIELRNCLYECGCIILIDSDLIAPANLIRLQQLTQKRNVQEEIIKEKVNEDSEELDDLESQDMQD